MYNQKEKKTIDRKDTSVIIFTSGKPHGARERSMGDYMASLERDVNAWIRVAERKNNFDIIDVQFHSHDGYFIGTVVYRSPRDFNE